MASGAKGNRDSERASGLKAAGIYHGKRMSSPNIDNPLSAGFTSMVGSAAYRRRIKKGRA